MVRCTTSSSAQSETALTKIGTKVSAAAGSGMKNKPKGKPMDKTVLCALALMLTSCGPIPPTAQDVVPLNRVPPGFQRRECRFVPLDRSTSPGDDCGLTQSLGAPGETFCKVVEYGGVGAPDEHSFDDVQCVHHSPGICLRSDGVVEPCGDRTFGPPTQTTSSNERCGDANGQVRSPEDCAG
jgi:hypothetical protein